MINRYYYIHREGYTSILWTFVLACIMLTFAIVCPWGIWIKYTIGTSFIILFFLVLSFFRMPKTRKYVQVKNALIAPADGEVVHIKKIYEPEYFKDERLQVSIFMSPMNVHVNRYPMQGFIKYFKYHPGRYLVAWHHKSSLLNERTTVVIENKRGVQILLRQIAGAVARRIVCYAVEGEEVEQCEEVGFIKFGSRVDLYLPLDTEVNVRMYQKVRGGIDIIAYMEE